AVAEGAGAEEIERALSERDGFRAARTTREEAERELRLGKGSPLVPPGGPGGDRLGPRRPGRGLARGKGDRAGQPSARRAGPRDVRETLSTEPGARYIDFLIPGLLGMNIMSGGMWGVGFVLVEMRSRKLLKRLIATPMRRSHFLGAMMGSRMVLVFL